MTFIHEDIPPDFKIMKDLTFVDSYNHCLGIKLKINNKSIRILNLYRSPCQSNDIFLDKFQLIFYKYK